MGKNIEYRVMRIAYVTLLTLSFLILVYPFYIPIIFAGTVSLALYPIMTKLESLGLSRRRAAGIVTTVFGFIISIPLFFFLIKGTFTVTAQLEKVAKNEKLKEQGVEVFVSGLRDDFVAFIHKQLGRFEFMDFLTPQRIDHYLDSVNTALLTFFRELAGSVPLLFMLLLIMILCTFSFLKHADAVRSFLQKVSGFSDEKMDELIKIYIRDSRQVYLSNIVTGGVQSLMVATGVSILGQGDFFLVFFITLILSFIPVIGAAPVAFVFGGIAFLKGENTYAVILVVLGSVTGVVDNILRPWLASFGESKIPPIVAFICVIGGALLFGFPGLFIGLLVGAFTYDTLPIFWEELKKDR